MTNEKPTFEYWIETGRTNGQFTLHRSLLNRPRHPMAQEYTYVRNIGRIYEEACERADKWIAEMHSGNYGFDFVKHYDPSDGELDCRHAGQYGDEQLWFGKYTGSDIEDVAANDRDYLIYLRDNFHRGPKNPRMNSLLRRLDEMELGESSREIAYRARVAAREEEERAYNERKQPIPTELAEGRSTFTGRIIAVFDRDSYYGVVTKMIFEDDRCFKLYCTVPAALMDDYSKDELRGAIIRFDAALCISDDDETFGFAKRPTKVEMIDKTETEEAA